MLRQLQDMLWGANMFVQTFQQVLDIPYDQAPDFEFVIHQDGTVDRRRYNAPTGVGADQIGALMPGDGPEGYKDVQARFRGGGLSRIHDCHHAYDGLHFPLLHPRGERGWDPNIPRRPGPPGRRRCAAVAASAGGDDNDDEGDNDGHDELEDHEDAEVEGRQGGRGKQKNVTCQEYAVWFMHDRPNSNAHFMKLGRVSQEWLVDKCGTVRAQRLRWVRKNQVKLRAESYRGAQDALRRGDDDPDRIGQDVILPSSHTGSPRYYAQCYQDAMAIVRRFGKPDLFITMTCNPKWKEVVDELEEGCDANDRVDLIGRVFKMKLDALLDDVIKKGVLGRVIGHVYVIEYQKRGLPHAHLLVILADEDKPRTPADYDAMVCAELPDEATHPSLHSVVTHFMLHGPCGAAHLNAPCMVDGVCSKRYPRPFEAETCENADGYPVYRRREDGRTTVKNGFVFDNSRVVPYNPWLSEKYQCHINVEVCTTVKAVKYLYKYVYKGPDRAQVRLVRVGDADGPAAPVDEVKAFHEGAYLSASEAVWRLFMFPIHGKAPNVLRLAVHLPEEQTVYITGGDVQRALNNSKTTLTEWFRFNHERTVEYERDLRDNPEAVPPPCLSVLYPDFGETHTWNKSKKEWRPRLGRNRPPVGRLYSASHGERFCLRTLLYHVAGATSFEQLRTTGYGTPEAQVWPTFREACVERGLLQDNAESDRTMSEAVSFAMGRQLRELYAILLAYNNVPQPKELWDKYQEHLVEDILHDARRYNPNRGIDQEIIDEGLRDVERHLVGMRKSLAEFQLPEPARLARGPESSVLLEERNRYDGEKQARERDMNVPQLNAAQRTIYNAVMAAVDSNGNYAGETAFFVDGLGGAGKTFLYGCLLSTVRAKGDIALAVASSGIAALLLEGGRTAHSRFKIPVQGLCDTSTCKVSVQSELADLIRAAKLIVWDEAPMMHRNAFEAVDKTFQDLMGRPGQVFGGKVVVMGGDFRQVLPVVPKGGRSQIVRASLNMSRSVWPHVQVHKLHDNMRVMRLLQQDNLDAQAQAKNSGSLQSCCNASATAGNGSILQLVQTAFSYRQACVCHLAPTLMSRTLSSGCSANCGESMSWKPSRVISPNGPF
jgi:hypothetical protein